MKRMKRRDFIRTGALTGLSAAAVPQTFLRGGTAEGLAATPMSHTLFAQQAGSSRQQPSMARQFARWAANLKYEDLPANVVDHVKALILHGMTGAVLGMPTAEAKAMVALIKSEEGRADGASILGDNAKVTRLGAAWANQEIIYYSHLIDSYRMIPHPGPALIAVALTNAELEKKNGKDLITALAAGYEFTCRLCHDFTATMPAHGFQPGTVFNTMGAAMVAGKLLGLDEEGLMRTITSAADYGSGLNEGGYRGDRQAARSGVFAALQARTGIFRPVEQILEGKAGFYKAFAGSNSGKLIHAFTGPLQIDLASITAGLGEEYKTTNVMFLIYARGGYNEGVINLMAEMRQQHKINPDDVAKVAVAMNWFETFYPNTTPAGTSDPDPDWNTPRVGRTHFYAAYALVNGGYPAVGGKSLSPNGVVPTQDKRVIDFMNAHVTLVQEKNREMFSPGAVITMKNGAVYKGEYPYKRMVLTFDQLVVRHQECLPGYSLGKAGMDAVVETIRGVDRLPSVDRIFQVMKA